MITGEQHKVTVLLKKAVDTAIKGGSHKVSEKNRKAAMIADIKLLESHQNAGHQTLEEYERSVATIEGIRTEQRRFNLRNGYINHAMMYFYR
jgi:hypothetical protein